MTGFFGEWLMAIWMILAQSGPWLLGGFFIAGLIKVLVPQKTIYKHLGKDDLRSATVASLAGVPIPLCSCSVIPTAIALRKSGASKGATTSFLISTPETGVDSIGVTWALMDPLMTIARPVSAFFTALGSGTLVNFLVKRGLDTPGAEEIEVDQAIVAGEEASCCSEPTPTAEEPGHPSDQAQDRGHEHAHDHDHTHDEDHTHPEDDGSKGVFERAFGYAFGTLLDDLTPWFVLGFLLSGLITVLVPDGFFGEALPSGWMSMVAMLVIGVPIYVCATASTPVAAALVAKGLDPGAALVFLLAGPATNMATIAVVQRFLGKRVLISYLGSIAVFSLGSGALLGFVYSSLEIDPKTSAAAAQHAGPGLIATIGGIILLLLLLRSAFRLRLVATTLAAGKTKLAPLGLDPTSKTSKAVASLAAILLYASTSVSSVLPGEVGFVTRFGRVTQERAEPGLVVHLPFPVDRFEAVRTGEVRAVEYGFQRASELTEEAEKRGVVRKSPRVLAEEAEVVTGSEEILKVAWAVHYRALDARKFRYGLGDPDALVGALSESALRRVAATLRADDMLVEGRSELEGKIHGLLAQEFEDLNVGLEATAVRLREVHAAPAVHESFRDLASAMEDKHRDLRRAESYRATRITKASGTAARLEQEALAESARILGESRGRAQAFLSVLEAYEEAPLYMRTRLRLETLRRTLDRARLVMILGPGIEVVRYPSAEKSEEETLQDMFGRDR